MAISTTHDITPDSPTNVFATLNPLVDTNHNYTLSDGNLRVTSSSLYPESFSTVKVNQNKFYAEAVLTAMGNQYTIIGVAGMGNYTNHAPMRHSPCIGYRTDGNKDVDVTFSAYGSSYTTNDIIGIFVDMLSNSVTFYKNGISQGAISYTFADQSFFFASGGYGTVAGTNSIIFNFGQDPSFGGNKTSGSADAPDANGIGQFYYQPPTGALALCTANLPDPDIDPNADDLPEDYFKAVKYQASNVNNQIQSVNVGFQPDLIWIKNRDNTETHYLTDTLRSSLTNNRLDKFLCSNETSTEATVSNRVTDATVTLKSYGYDISDSNMANGELYFGSRQYICWAWKAGGAPDLTSSPTKPFAKDNVQYETLSAAGITAGTITPTAMSVNTKAGFSIVKYVGTGSTGGTVPHGLDKKPDIVIIKNLIDGTKSWNVTSFLTTPSTVLTDSIFNIGSKTGGVLGLNLTTSASAYSIDGQTSGNGQDHIAYCWHSVAGYSAFGSYTGNGSSTGDGPFIFTGFSPSFILLKSTSAEEWGIVDNARDPYNSATKYRLFPNSSNQEDSNAVCDFLSNGFKVNRGGGGTFNVSGRTYIYACFAEMPFKYSATNAR